jgi:uncharacterized protein (DUF885 family)
MLNRRALLTTAAAAGLAPLAGCATAGGPQSTPADANAASEALLRTLGDEVVASSPELATNLGLDKGANAALKAQLSPRSAEAIAAEKRDNADRLRRLEAIDRARLSGLAAVNYDTTLDQVRRVQAGARFDYGDFFFADWTAYSLQPYTISQLTGVYQSAPDFLDSQHTIETVADADAYISRLEALAGVLDQETERARRDAARGVLPPDFIVAKALGQLRGLRGQGPSESVLVTSVVRRAREKSLAGDWAGRTGTILTGRIHPALDRQIAFLAEIQPRTTHDAGVWRLPDGDGYYAVCLSQHTTTDLTAEQIHQLGLDQSKALLARMDAILRGRGLTQGTVGQRMAALGRDPQFLYPNTEAGKAQLLEDLRGQVAVLKAKLPQYFGTLPKADVEVRRVPPYIEAGAPGGYAVFPSLDGSRPGAYYINLRDTAEWPKYTLPTLTYHESVPGHHLQGTLAIENPGIPNIRKFMNFGAFTEGWALYAEQLADEMGMYRDDPFGELGYLQSLLFRASRLVVDTGLHAKRWSREQAIRYMAETGGDDEGSVTSEVERYCVWPGQATGYKVGHTRWVDARERAKAALGPRFDIRRFHDATLLSGSMPLSVLDRVVDDWTRAQAA